MKTTTVSGRVIEARVERKDCPRFPNIGDERRGEIIDFFLSVSLEGDDGVVYYFNSSPTTRNVFLKGGERIVSFHFSGGAIQWMAIGDKNQPIPLVGWEEKIVVSGRLEMKTSRVGKAYGKLTHVKRVS